jgi:hypothetical protein
MSTSTLQDSDFAPLERFALLWRWTSPTHAVLPAAALATIRPLQPAAIARFDTEAEARCLADGAGPAEGSFAADALDAAGVRARLEQLEIASTESVLVHWNRDLAVQTTWATFVRYWDSFCYPASDDVTVWAPGADWTLCYWHHEHMTFRRAAVA